MTVEHSNTENTTALRIYYCGREQWAGYPPPLFASRCFAWKRGILLSGEKV